MTTTATASLPTGGPTNMLIDKFGLSPETMSPIERRSAISGYDLRYRIEALVAGVTGEKIRHIYTGDGAATAPGLMILPAIPATALFPMRHVLILLGYAAHEISHQLETSFALLEAMLADPSISDVRKQQLKEFWNGIEDYRIEKVVRNRFPGFHHYIDHTRDFSARRFVERVDAGLIPQKALANPYAMGAVTLTWIGARMNGYKTRAPDEALSKLDPFLRQWFESWENELAGVETCIEARDLANLILDELDTMAERQGQGEESDPQDDPDHNVQSGPGAQPGAPSLGGNGQKPTAGNLGAEDESAGDGQTTHENKGQAGANASEHQARSHSAAVQEAQADQSEEASSENIGGNDNERTTDDQAGSAHETASREIDGGSQVEAAGSKDSGPITNGENQNSDGGDPEQVDSACDQPAHQGANSEADRQSAPMHAAGRQAGNAAPRPQLKISEGDDQAAAEQADLEIDELQKAINAMDGCKAQDPIIFERDALIEACQQNSEEVNLQRGQERYAEIRAQIKAPAARAAGIMRRLLQSRNHTTWRRGKEEGELDFNRLVPMVQGAPDIYRQRHEKRAINTALGLLLDNSGSMSGAPLEVCQRASVVLDQAVSGTPTNIEITGFTGSRVCTMIYRYRAFGQKAQAAAATLGNMDEVPLGGTPVAVPLLEQWRRLSQQREPRRIMIVVSDGGADDSKEAREAHDFIVSQGCIVLGIAIGAADGPMKLWCDRVASIETVDELPVALTTLVQGIMR